jgi:hypothetical protein
MTTDFHGLPVRSLENDHLRVDYLLEAGPRLARLILAGSTDNLLAEVPDVHWPTPWGEYHLRGGHRVAIAPEALGLSYVPDDDDLVVEDVPGGVRLIRPTEIGSGVSKSIEIQLQPDRPALLCGMRSATIALNRSRSRRVHHRLALGGVAVAPLRTASLMDRHRPDRHLVLWPYTTWRDERLFADDDYVWIDARPDPQELKIGLLAGGWLGYLRSGVFFLKRFDPQLELPHPDLNTNAQLYCNHRFIELESLAPLAVLEPGQSSVHVETWEIFRDVDVPQTIEGLGQLIRSLVL